MKKTVKFTALLAALSLSLCGCNISRSNERSDPQKPGISSANDSPSLTPSDTASEYENNAVTSLPSGRGTMLSLSDTKLEITRLSKENNVSFKDDMWTVFVYMCGSDLESDQGSGTDDMIEMQEATGNCSNLRFVVEADGTREWQNELCEDGKKQRLVFSGGGCDVVYSGESTNMGASGTLEDFLKWGIEEYGSKYMVLDLWNHGGGSINGVCFDELNDDDSLSLLEIDKALAAVYEDFNIEFQLMGCDACLMGAVELANIFASYSDFMIASQNLETGNGWDYNAFSDAINAGVTNGGDLGKYLCDGYYNSCILTGEQNEATMSVIDLSELDAFLTEFNAFSSDLYDFASDSLTDIIRAAKSTLNFGGNNRSEGYTNMVDIKNLLYYTSDYSNHADKTAQLLNKCIVYSRNGESLRDAGGLSVYYPLCVQGSSELNMLKDICVSPYYLSLSDLCAYGSDNNGSIDGYNSNSWLGTGSLFWSDDSISLSDYDYWELDNSTWLNSDTNSTAITFETEPNIDEEGMYNFTLTKTSLYDLDTVYCNIMMSHWDEEDNCEYMLDLGTDNYVDLDWDTGYCCDAFDGIWFALPDGQPICVYLVETYLDENEYYNIYTSPIYLNGEYTNLRIKQDYSTDELQTTILGIWDGISDSGSAARDIYQLQAGDIIEPCYYAYDADTLEYVTDFYGDEYIYDGYSEIGYGEMYYGDYYYSFEIYDYYGSVLYTDFVLFGIDEEGLYYYGE